MPLKYIHPVLPDGAISIWRSSENEDYYERRLDIIEDERKLLLAMSPRKKQEWLSSRYLLHIMTGQSTRSMCSKDEYGKPIMTDSDHHISLSHSGDLTAVIVSKTSVGVDIQIIVDKIARISRKFCNEYELAHIPLGDESLYYHIIWGAKECIYKSYGKRKIDFRGHMTISGIENVNKGSCKGRLKINDLDISYKITYELMDGYMLTYSVEM